MFAREFFLTDRRAKFPKLPACETCNNVKSKLEHYLTAVLPFGGRYTDELVTSLAAPATLSRSNRSPVAVSQKREYFKYPPETIGEFTPAVANFGARI